MKKMSLIVVFFILFLVSCEKKSANSSSQDALVPSSEFPASPDDKFIPLPTECEE